MEKRYQVFVSSTFTDLREERQGVTQALMEMDCIPAGMELFPASDDEQFEFIKRVIDDCDYYVLIVAGRYGSLSPEGVSYTEKEFDYACSRGIRVLAFLHEKTDSLPVEKSESDATCRDKLYAFRDKVAKDRLVKFWEDSAELPGMVALSLNKAIKMHPAIGWIRGDNQASSEVLSDLNKLRKENDSLKSKVNTLEGQLIPQLQDLAGLESEFSATLTWTTRSSYGSTRHKEKISVTWSRLFSIIAPSLLDHPLDASVCSKLADGLYRSEHSRSQPPTLIRVEQEDFETVRVQLVALGLVDVRYSKNTKGGMSLFWGLTRNGQKLMTELRCVKASQ